MIPEISKKGIKHCQDFLSKIDYIDRGGCGISVYAIYLYLKSNDILSDDFQIVSIHPDEEDDSYNANKQYLDGNTTRASAAYHFGFTFDGGITVYDCNGLFIKSYWSARLLIPKAITEAFIVAALNERNWNPCFDRDIEIPKIESYLKIKINLNDVNTQL